MEYLSDLQHHNSLIEQQLPFIQQERAKNRLEAIHLQISSFIQLLQQQQNIQSLVFQFAGLLGNATLFLTLLSDN